jgi:hypothetical protein
VIPGHVVAAVVIGVVTGLVLLAIVFVCWHLGDSLTGYRRPISYVIGVGLLLIAYGVWAVVVDAVLPVAVSVGDVTLLTGCAGAIHLAAYRLHYWAERKRAGRETARMEDAGL